MRNVRLGEMDVMVIVVNVWWDGDKECLGVCHVQGYVGMG
jgi:hypothetical protein